MKSLHRRPISERAGNPREESLASDRAEHVLLVALVALVAVNVMILLGEDLRTVLESAVAAIAALATRIG